MSTPPRVTKLESGYWHVRWSSEIWAQWPVGRPVTKDAFFHAEGTFTEARAKCAAQLTGEAYV